MLQLLDRKVLHSLLQEKSLPIGVDHSRERALANLFNVKYPGNRHPPTPGVKDREKPMVQFFASEKVFDFFSRGREKNKNESSQNLQIFDAGGGG